MGYTHYWTPKVATPERWKSFKEVCKQLHEELPQYTETAGGYSKDDDLEIFGGMGTGKPKFSMKEIWFNGDERKGLDHETFLLAPDKLDWNFCKTARKPYDLLVVACLLAAYDYLGYEVSSDGGYDDWKEGLHYYLDTIYDINTLDQDAKNEIANRVTPNFIKEDYNGR